MKHISSACWAAILAIGIVVHAANAETVQVYALGDSMMKIPGRSLEKALKKQDISCEALTSIGSGLARMDLFDWGAKASTIVAEKKPETVFVMMGANDGQPMQGSGRVIQFGTPEWDAEYGRRAGNIMDTLTEGGVKLVCWIGLPCMRDKTIDEQVRSINQIVKEAASSRSAVTFFETYEMFSRKGGYSSYIIQATGMPLDVRAADGIHLNRAGAQHLTSHLLETVIGAAK